MKAIAMSSIRNLWQISYINVHYKGWLHRNFVTNFERKNLQCWDYY